MFVQQESSSHFETRAQSTDMLTRGRQTAEFDEPGKLRTLQGINKLSLFYKYL